MELSDVYRHLSESIMSGTCIGLLGAGTSSSTTFGGELYKGLPTGTELMNVFKENRDYLKEVSDLGQAAFLIREYEGRGKLEALLTQIFSHSKKIVLPAYKHLVSLNLSCYISFNFDEILEAELEAHQVKLLRICSDNEVPLLDKYSVPVIKPHGTIQKPSGICIATDEIFSFEDRIPIVSELMLSQIAGKTLLALGFSFTDPDFLTLLRFLKTSLGEYMPRTHAIMLQKNTFTSKFWGKYNVNIIKSDLTEFLFELNKYVKKQKLQLEEDLEPWLKNKFFWQLLEIRGKPTETQTIEALLGEIKTRISNKEDIAKLKEEVNEAVNLVCSYRRNYHALRQIGSEIDTIFNRCVANNVRPWNDFNILLNQRIHIRNKINQKASDAVAGYKNILLYSQSQRVVDMLLSVDPQLQEEIRLFIAECRPKSPTQFQDAILYARLLRTSKYRITVVPDVAMFHLLTVKRVDLVLMGAHVVYQNNKTNAYEYFVNTNGSEVIVHLASEMSIPVKIVFEKGKVKVISSENEIQVSYDEEEDITRGVIPQISNDPLLAEKVLFMNIGYDLVRWNSNLLAVSDD